MKEYQSLSHTRWDCKYHIVFIPKRRKKKVFGVLRRYLGEIFHVLALHKESKIVEGHMMGDHVHMCLSIPPKYAVSNVVGYLKGEECDSDCEKVWWAAEELRGGALLGSRIFCLDGWIRRAYCSSIHPQPGRGRRAVRSNEACHRVSRQGRLRGSWAPLRRSSSQATGSAGGI